MVSKKYEFIKPIMFALFMVFVLFTLLFLGSYMVNKDNGCVQHEVCYKTECNFWGCGKIRVDVDSAQCEVKKIECE